jgi:hypothetical protein
MTSGRFWRVFIPKFAREIVFGKSVSPRALPATDRRGLEGLPIPAQFLDTPNQPPLRPIIGFLPSSACSSILYEASILPAALHAATGASVRVRVHHPFRNPAGTLDFGTITSLTVFDAISLKRSAQIEPGISNIGSVTQSGHVTEYRRPRAPFKTVNKKRNLSRWPKRRRSHATEIPQTYVHSALFPWR